MGDLLMSRSIKVLKAFLIVVGCLSLLFLVKSYLSGYLGTKSPSPLIERGITTKGATSDSYFGSTISGQEVARTDSINSAFESTISGKKDVTLNLPSNLIPSDSSGGYRQEVVNSQDNPAFSSDSRMVIKNASLSLTVKDVEETTVEVQKFASEYKGYVASASTRIIDEKEGSKISSIIIKVPAADFETAVSKIKSLAIKVINETITNQDTTEDYVDLTGKVKNLEATRDQLYEVMKKAEKIPDILEVQRELTTVTGQIEQIRGRMQYLEKSSALGTITLSIATEEKELPVIEQGWDPLKTVKNAFRSLVSVIQNTTDLGLWLVIFFGPFILILLLVRMILKMRRK